MQVSPAGTLHPCSGVDAAGRQSIAWMCCPATPQPLSQARHSEVQGQRPHFPLQAQLSGIVEHVSWAAEETEPGLVLSVSVMGSWANYPPRALAQTC